MTLGALRIGLDVMGVNPITSSGTEQLLLELADLYRPSLFKVKVPILTSKCCESFTIRLSNTSFLR